MKSLSRTIVAIAVFAALDLAAAGYAVAGEKGENAVVNEAEMSRHLLEHAAARKAAIEEDAEEVRLLQSITRLQQLVWNRPPIPAMRYASSGKVLVIPAAGMDAEQLIAVTEDMSVMCRIFDKTLIQRAYGIYSGSGGGYGGRYSPPWLSVSVQDQGLTEGIYLAGYGALFLMKVDFPLSPSAEAKEERPKEGADEIWEQTKQEIYEPEKFNKEKRSAEKYNAEKVEEFKRKLIKALKHAANIRNLKGQEWVIIAVRGNGRRDGGYVIRPSVLTIRATKSDVDAFAKGELDFDKFRQKVQIFTY